MTDVATDGLIVVAPGDGEPRTVGNSRITMNVTAAQTNGGYGLIASEAARSRPAEKYDCAFIGPPLTLNAPTADQRSDDQHAASML